MNNLCKILIVDDEYLLRQGLRYLCNWEKEGFTIVGEASSGEEAIKLTKCLNPNIIITDIVMPEIDGIELTKLIKLYNPKIEIIVLSSYSDFDYVKKSFKYGVRDYILKPKLQPDELLPILKNLKKDFSYSCASPLKLDFKKSLSSTLQSLINGFSCDETQLNQINSYFTYSEFFLLITDVNSYFRTTTEQELKEYIFSPQLISQYLGEFICSERLVIQNTYAVLINVDIHNSTYLKSKIKELCTQQNKQFKNLHFAISKSFTSLNNLKAVFEDSKTLLSYQFF